MLDFIELASEAISDRESSQVLLQSLSTFIKPTLVLKGTGTRFKMIHKV